MYYLRIENNNFSFVSDKVNNILTTDKAITNKEYNEFFNMQSKGKQFRVKEEVTGTGLFDYIEEYTPEPAPYTPTELELLQEEALEQSEYMVEMDYRLMNLELGL